MLHQAHLLRWANWFSQWKFEVRHIKGKNNFLSESLSRIQRTISPIFPLIYCFQPEDLPAHVKDKILYFVSAKKIFILPACFPKDLYQA